MTAAVKNIEHYLVLKQVLKTLIHQWSLSDKRLSTSEMISVKFVLRFLNHVGLKQLDLMWTPEKLRWSDFSYKPQVQLLMNSQVCLSTWRFCATVCAWISETLCNNEASDFASTICRDLFGFYCLLFLYLHGLCSQAEPAGLCSCTCEHLDPAGTGKQGVSEQFTDEGRRLNQLHYCSKRWK